MLRSHDTDSTDGLLGLRDLVMSEGQPEERERYLRQIFDLSERMKTVIDDLLALGLKDSHPQPEIAPHCLEDMVIEVIAAISNKASHKGVIVSIDPPVSDEFPREFLTDRRQFKNILYR